MLQRSRVCSGAGGAVTAQTHWQARAWEVSHNELHFPRSTPLWLQSKLFYAYEKINLFCISGWVITLVINLSWYSVVLHTLKNKHSRRSWLQKRHNLFCWRMFSSNRKDKKTCTHYYDIVTIKKEVDLGWYLVFLTRYQPYLVLLGCLLSMLKIMGPFSLGLTVVIHDRLFALKPRSQKCINSFWWN